MLFNRTLALTLCLLSTPTAAFHIGPPSGKKTQKLSPSSATKTIASVLTAGAISAATILPLPSPATAADLMGTPLEARLSQFGAASYPVFNSVSDVSPLAERFVDFIETKIRPADAGAVAEKAVDGLLAIPDSSVQEYSGVLRQVVYGGVNRNSCVVMNGSGKAVASLFGSDPLRSVPPSKIAALKSKFSIANTAVPVRGGDVCMPGSVSASQELWVAQAELTFSMPKKEATELVKSVQKLGPQIPRSTLIQLVPSAASVFSKSPEAMKMVQAGKDVEPYVISFAKSIK